MPTLIQVQASAVKMYETLPHRNIDAVANAVVQHRSIQKALIASDMTGGHYKYKRLIRFAKEPNYYYGMPEFITQKGPEIPDGLAAHLDTLPQYPMDTPALGSPINVPWYSMVGMYNHTLSNYGPTQDEVWDIHALYNLYIDLDPALEDFDTTNLTIDGQAIVITHEPTLSRITYGSNVRLYTKVTSSSVKHIGAFHKQTRFVDPATGDNVLYYTGTFWFYYDEDDGTLPWLHASPDTVYIAAEEIPPTVPIRINSVNVQDILTPVVAGVHPSPADCVDKLLGRIPMDLSAVTENLEESPDFDNLTDAYLHIGTSVTEDAPWGIYSLIKSFEILSQLGAKPKTYMNISVHDPSLPPDLQKALEGIGDTTAMLLNYTSLPYVEIHEQTFDNRLSWASIEFETIVGVEEWSNTVVAGTSVTKFIDYSKDDGGDSGIANMQVGGDTIILRMPDGNTGNSIQCTVTGLSSSHTIIERTSKALTEEDSLLIPLFYSTMESAPKRMRDDIFFGSSHIVVYAVQRIHLAWYETTTFQMFMQFVALVFMGPLAPGFAFTGNALINALIHLGLKLLLKYAIEYVTRWLTEELGALGAFIGAILNIYVANGFSFKGLADSLYATMTNTFKVLNTYQGSMGELWVGKTLAMQDEYTRRLEEIKQGTDSLNLKIGGTLNLIDGGIRIEPHIILGETPTDFYTRTSTHLDLTRATLGYVDDYYEQGVALPSTSSFD